MTRAVIYARVSTADQSTDLQLHDLREYAKARGFDVVAEYVDEAVSGARTRRPGLDQLMADAHQRRFEVVLTWKLDRLGRSLSHLIRLAETFEGLGVDLVSLRDPGLDTTTAHGKLIFSVMGAVAEFERSMIQERTEAGREAARRRGTRFGRPSSLSQQQQERIARLRYAGQSFRVIARTVGTSSSTVARVVSSGPLCQKSSPVEAQSTA